MQRVVLGSLVALFFAVAPAHAQTARRPFLQRLVRSPAVNQAANLALSYFLPGFPNIPLPGAPSGDSTLYVDASVKRSIDATGKNLRDADDIMKALLEKHKDTLSKKVEEKKDLPKAVDKKDEKEPDPAAKKIAELLGKGQTAFLAGRFEEALSAYIEANKLNPNDENAISGMLLTRNELRGDALLMAIKVMTEELRNQKKSGVVAKTAPFDVAIKPIPVVVPLPKNGSVTLPVELIEPAVEDLTLSVVAKGIDAPVLTSKGSIKKGEKAGVVTITTANVPAITAITVNIAATAQTKAASISLKVKVE